MYALKSNLKKYTTIFLLYYVLRCIAIVSTHPPGVHINLSVGYDINGPHYQHTLITNSNDGEYLQMPSREQHPWERRPFAHHHGQIFQNNLNIKTHPSESSSEECVQCPTESRANINAPIHGFTHRDRFFPAMRLNGNALDTEKGVYDLHHPWRVQWPHRRHRFHHRRWHAEHFEPDTDESSEENEQVDTTADRAKAPSNNWRNSLEPIDTNGGSPKEEAEMYSTTVATGTAKTPGNNWRESLEPIDTNRGSPTKDAEMDSTTAATGTAKETTTPPTIATTAISEESTTLIEKTTNSQEVQTTTIVNSLTTPTTDNANTFETTEAALSIDIRSGFA